MGAIRRKSAQEAQQLLKWKMRGFKQHWMMITFDERIYKRYSSKKYSPLHDMFILYMVSKHGQDAWKTIKCLAKREPLLACDFFFLTRKPTDLKQRFSSILNIIRS